MKMKREKSVLISLIVISVSIFIIDKYYENIQLEKAFITTLLLAIFYFIFEFLIRGKAINRIKEPEGRYYLSKIISFSEILIFILIIGIIWLEDIQGLMLSLGIIAAAFTITLQDVAKNFVGGLSIFLKNIYRVGDRIEIASKKGDVIDIGLLYTTIMETDEWISGDQHTGRISTIPNGHVLNNTINNYTKDFEFLWDEIMLPITYDSDWRAATELFQKVLENETEQIALTAKTYLDKLENKYYPISLKNLGSSTFMKLTDNWIELNGRYIINARERRAVRSRINQQMLEGIEKLGNIRLASQTIDIVDFPELKISKDFGNDKRPN